MSDISERVIVLKLNRSWIPMEVVSVQKAIVDLVSEVVEAVDVNYKINKDGSVDFGNYNYIQPLKWEEWIKLPVHPWNYSISTSKMVIRVPNVVISKNYDKIPMKKYKKIPTKEALYYRDGGRDIYTNKVLEYDEGTIDHIVPLHRGGKHTFENTALTTKFINNKKGDKLVSEIGFKLHFKPTLPRDIPKWKLIKTMKHEDWHHFFPK